MRRRIVVIAAAAATVLVWRGSRWPPISPTSRPRTLRGPRRRRSRRPTRLSRRPEAGAAASRKADDFVWRHYGYSKDHRRFFAPPASFRGPFLTVWKRKAPALLEFPPVMARESIFQLADNGQLASLRKKNGKVRWKKKLGRLAASAPALGGGRVYVTLLEGGRGAGRGRVVALRQRNGKQRWSRTLPSRSESSPLLHDGRLYFGSENGTLYCLDADNGKVIWTYRAAGAIKGSPTLAHGKLFFGDYGGRVQAVRASNGRRVWSSSGCGALLRDRGGRRAQGLHRQHGGPRVRVLDPQRAAALVAPDGALRLRVGGGQPVRGRGPTVFVGSYDGRFYALSARTGRVRWTYNSGGKISGSATVIGKVVYFADLGHRRTIGLGTRTGRVVFRKDQGAYDPVISDGKHLYLTGNHSLTALRPLQRHGKAARQRAARRAGGPRSAGRARSGAGARAAAAARGARS